eukprot:753636-Hanusia_phi.AAC.3
MDAERRPHGLVRVDAAPRGGRRDVGERRAVGGVERKCVGKGHVGGGREGAERVAGADGKASSIICTEPDLVLGHHRCSHASRHEEPAGGARIDSLRDAAELDPGRTEDTGVCPAVPDVDALLPEERVAVVEAHGWLPAPEPVSYPQGVIAAQPQEERKPVLLLRQSDQPSTEGRREQEGGGSMRGGEGGGQERLKSEASSKISEQVVWVETARVAGRCSLISIQFWVTALLVLRVLFLCSCAPVLLLRRAGASLWLRRSALSKKNLRGPPEKLAKKLMATRVWAMEPIEYSLSGMILGSSMYLLRMGTGGMVSKEKTRRREDEEEGRGGGGRKRREEEGGETVDGEKGGRREEGGKGRG